jgi:hypothetical protein
MDAAKTVGIVVAGGAATNFIASMIPFTDAPGATTYLGLAPIESGKRIAIAAGLGWAAEKYIGKGSGVLVIAGGILSLVNAALKSVLPATATAYLGDAGAYPALASYPVGALALPVPAGIGGKSGRMGGGAGMLRLPMTTSGM